MHYCYANQAVLVPKQRGIQTEVEPIFLPVGEHRLDDGFVESVDVNPAIAEPSSDASLLALSIVPPARKVGSPSRQVDFAGLNQGGYHPQARCQVAQVYPVVTLTQPTPQGMVEAGVFFTAFLSFEWYLILECWLPLLERC